MLNLIVAYVLGVVSAFVLILLLLMHKAPAPTLAARRRQLPVREGEIEEPLYIYGVTGEEQ